MGFLGMGGFKGIWWHTFDDLGLTIGDRTIKIKYYIRTNENKSYNEVICDLKNLTIIVIIRSWENARKGFKCLREWKKDE